MKAAGIEVIARHVALGEVTVTTAGSPRVTYHLSGPFEIALSTSRWRLASTPGTYSIFRATHVRPADWLVGADRRPDASTKIRNAAWGDSWVSVTRIARSSSCARWRTCRAGARPRSTRRPAHSVELTVTRHGLVQGVHVPPGDVGRALPLPRAAHRDRRRGVGRGASCCGWARSAWLLFSKRRRPTASIRS